MMTQEIVSSPASARSVSSTQLQTHDSNNVVAIAAHSNPNVQAAKTKQEDANIDLKQAADELNEYAASLKRNLQFSVDHSSNKVVIKVIESSTGEIIRQIPSEELVSLSKLFREGSDLAAETPGLLLVDSS